MRVTILGCGSSGGVPFIGCDCPVCTSNNPKNKRLRVSVLVEINGLNILIDTSPDLRQQALRHNIKKVDAVLYTHDHADHIHGIDDLRSFNYLRGDVLPVYGVEKTLLSVQQRFPYVFGPKPKTPVWYKAALLPHYLPEADRHDFAIEGVNITMFRQIHGARESVGYRIGDFAYSTDVNQLPEEAFSVLDGVSVWVVDCLRYTESPGHSNYANTIKWVERVKPGRAILTHMAHEFDYERLVSELPTGIIPAFDGMIIEI